MFVVALTLQSGLGLTAFQSGNAFIALGVAYFISSLLSTRVVERLGKVPTLITGCLIQMSGLLILAWTFNHGWPNVGIVQLIPATALIGFGQAFIVSCFFRIGLAEVPKSHAGAGSAMLSTVQQAAFGLGPMVLGAVYSHALLPEGNYQHAVLLALGAEWAIMLALVISAVILRRGTTQENANVQGNAPALKPAVCAVRDKAE